MKWEILPFHYRKGGISVIVKKCCFGVIFIPILKRSFTQTAGR